MKKKYLGLIIICAIILLSIFLFIKMFIKIDNDKVYEFKGMVMGYNDNQVFVADKNNIIHSFLGCQNVSNLENIAIKYSGLLDKEPVIKSCEEIEVNNDLSLPKEYQDEGIFSQYYKLAYETLNKLSLEEKIGQLLLVRFPTEGLKAEQKYKFAGFVFYENDFKNKDKKSVKKMISNLQDVANIPLLTAVDEEGGKVIRVSSNPNLVSSPFLSPSELYNSGGFSAIKEDTINKSKILKELGLNLNLSPVVDVSTSPSDYIYDRTLKKDTTLVKQYAEDVITSSKNTGVSYTLKHFPGYSSSVDTHYSAAVNNASFENIKKTNLPPFESGIKAGAEAVLVSHIITDSIDEDNPASLSINTHNLLRDDLQFSGVIISDDLAMGATASIENKEIKALLAGNDLLIVTDYEEAFNNIKKGLDDNTISENLINKLAFKVIAWKYYKGLMYEK